MPRPLYFEIHIRPMFREIDQVHMKSMFDIDLWDYGSVQTNINMINGFLTQHPSPNDANAVMPPSDSGGPWPEAWLALWADWKQDPKSLPLGTGTYEVRDSGGGMLRLQANGSPSKPNAAVWLERLPGRDIPPRFVLYEEPPRDGIKGTDIAFILTEDFPPGSAKYVEVTDSTGTHQVPYP
jgi:hypothetical protein